MKVIVEIDVVVRSDRGDFMIKNFSYFFEFVVIFMFFKIDINGLMIFYVVKICVIFIFEEMKI